MLDLEDVKACAFCYNMCRHVCTIASIIRAEHSTPRAKALLLHSVLKGTMKMDEGLARQIYICANCGRCQEWCETKAARPPEVFEEARAWIVEIGLAPAEALDIKEGSERANNVYGEPGHRFEALRDRVRSEGPVQAAYYMGDSIAYLRPEIARAVASIFDSIGLEFAVPAGEVSDGLLLYILGFRDLAKRFAELNVKAIKALKPSLVIFSDPMSYTAFKRYYPRIGIDTTDLKPIHLSEYLSGIKLDLGRFDIRSTYLDPCFLGRRSEGIYDRPRHLLTSIPGMELVEMKSNREMAPCCGGLLRPIDTGPARRACERIREMVEGIGVDLVVTSCPLCKEGLIEAGVDAMDLAEVVSRALEGG